jgi:hypothetical protein
MDHLIQKLKKEDAGYSRLSKSIQIVYWILVPFYLFMVIRMAMAGSPLPEILSSVFFLFAMLIFALFFRHYYKEYKYVDYSQPTLIMLKKAAYRYKPFQLKTLWVLLAVLLVNAGLSLGTKHFFDLLGVQFVFWGVMIISGLIGLWIWKIRYKPIRDAALKMIREIECDD